MAGSDPNDLASILIRSTFKLEGGGLLGTVFVLRQPLSGDPPRARYVLITAAHVLEDMKGETATLHLRQPKGDGFARLTFPILRSGRIASFPLVPTSTTMAFLLDFPVFSGNSGGPVFMFDSNRVYAGSTHIGTTSLLLGLVSQQKNVTETIRSLDQTLTKDHSLGIAVVVHASFIRDVMNQLPSPAPDALASEPK